MKGKTLKLGFKLTGRFKGQDFVFFLPGTECRKPYIRKRRTGLYCYLPGIKAEGDLRDVLQTGFKTLSIEGYKKAGIEVEKFLLHSLPQKDIAKIFAEEIIKISYPVSEMEWVVFLFSEKCLLQEFKEAFDSHKGYILRKISRIPVPTVDAIITLPQNKILLIRRKNPPFGWALPGGFLEYNESLEECVKREVEEETGLKVTSLRQFHTYSQPGRDPRFHTVSTVFLVKTKGIPRAGSDARDFGIFKINALPSRKNFAFDHWYIIRDWLKSLENK